MISKNEVKYIQSLSDKKNRNHHGTFVAEGQKVVTELLYNGISAQIIYTTQKAIFYNLYAVPVKEISTEDLKRITHFETANEVLAVFYKRKLSPLQLTGKFTLLLDGIQDPGNMGTIIRTADWFGVQQIIASHDSVDCYNNKVVQSTMGSIARVNVYYENIEVRLRDSKVQVLGARLNGMSLYKAPKLKEGILVIGNESRGIRPNILPFIQSSVTIPKAGNAESLNAAVATGIILSHLLPYSFSP